MQRLLSFFSRPLVLALGGLALGAFALAGCDSSGPSSDGSEVQVGFTTSSTSSSQTSGASAKDQHDALTLEGTNGTLEITDIRLIVSEIELEGDADSAEFEMEEPRLLDLPLDSSDFGAAATDRVPPGTYTEFDFEVDNVELDDDDDEEELQALRDQIANTEYDNWPDGASMVVQGTFTPSDGDTGQDFRAYFDAEIEVEVEMEDNPFEIGGGDDARRLTVNLDPARWFSNPDDTVQDLSQNHYETEDDLVDFELDYEFEDGVGEIEFDD
jgi:hypothetical protein